jgi:hypothetical protein
MIYKKIGSLLFLGFLLAILSPVVAQQDINQRITNAITNANAKDLASVFASSISLSLPGIDGIYSKSQAEMILKDFFVNNKPVSFKIKHSGQSREGARYSIGKMLTANKVFNIYYLMKDSGTQTLVIQFQIEKTDK